MDEEISQTGSVLNGLLGPFLLFRVREERNFWKNWLNILSLAGLWRKSIDWQTEFVYVLYKYDCYVHIAAGLKICSDAATIKLELLGPMVINVRGY